MNRRVVLTVATLGVAFALSLSRDCLAGNLRLVALKGQQAPGAAAGVNFAGFDDRAPALNNSGHVAFSASLSGGGVTSPTAAGIWSEGGDGTLKLIARAGSSAPGTAAGVNFSGFTIKDGPILNDVGQTAFVASLTGTGVTGGVNSLGIFAEGSGSLGLVARTGSPAPGTPAGVTFGTIIDQGSSGPVGLLFNNAGKVGFQGSLTGPSVSSNQSTGNATGIWSGGGSQPLALVAREGSVAPGLTDKFRVIYGESGPVMNNLGQIAFNGGTNTTGGVWSEVGGNGLKLIYKRDDPAPGVTNTTVFSGFQFHPAINDAGKIAFTASIWTTQAPSLPSNAQLGVWSTGKGNGLELVARAATPAPGASAGNFGGDFFSERVMNGRGEVAFMAAAGGVTGIWSEGGGNGLHRVAQALFPAPGFSSGVTFYSFSYLDGPAVNARGQVAFRSYVTGPGVNNEFLSGIWAEDTGGVLRLIVRRGQLLDVSTDPNAPIFKTVADVFFAGRTGNEDSRRSGFNDLGQVAFLAKFTDGSQGVFVSDLVAVPEPASVLILAVCTAVTSAARRRRRWQDDV